MHRTDTRHALAIGLVLALLPESSLRASSPNKSEAALIAAATGDMDAQSFRINLRAIETLGAMKSVKAVPALIQAAFMRAKATENKAILYRTTRLALARIGPAATPHLIKTLTGANTPLSSYARRHGIASWEISEGPETVQLLTGTLDPRALLPLVANLKTLSFPDKLSDIDRQRWITAQQNRFTTLLLGLAGFSPQNAAIPQLAKIVADQDADAVRQRLNAARILAYFGTPKAQDRLLDLWENDPMWMERKADMFRAALLIPLLEGLDHTRMKRFRALIANPSPRVAAKLKEIQTKTYQTAIDTCKGNPGCWLSLTDTVPRLCGDKQGEAYYKCADTYRWLTLKACVMLMRANMGDPNVVSEAMLRRLLQARKGEVDFRRFTLIVLARRGTAKHGKKLLRMADKLDRSDVYWPDEFRAVGHALIHRGDSPK